MPETNYVESWQTVVPLSQRTGVSKEYPLVYVIILNWNGWQDTVECLDSLRLVTYPRFRTVVLDNGSTDRSVERLEEWASRNGIKYTSVDLEQLTDSDESGLNQPLAIIRSEQNLGFSRGNNVVIRFAVRHGGDSFTLLNNDTIVDPDFITNLVAIGQRDSVVGLVGGRIYFRSSPSKIWYSKGHLDLFRGGARSEQGSFEGSCACSYVIGCLMLIQRSVIEDIGLLDERYFFGGEDWDYSRRAIEAGWKLVATSDARIWHKGSRSSGGDGSYMGVYYPNMGRMRFILDLPLRYRVVALAYFLLTRFFRAALWIMRGRRDLGLATFRALRDGAR